MLKPEEILRRASNCYADFLRSIVNGDAFFPLTIRFGKPSGTDDFDKLRGEITALTSANLGCHIQWTAVNTRRWGQQRLPERVEFLDEGSYLNSIGKLKEVSQFRHNLTFTRERCPLLVPIIAGRPQDAVEFGSIWQSLVEVCCHFQAHPRPNLYARELPLSVDTKFIEQYKSILFRLLNACLPPEAIFEGDRFEERFGLHFDEPMIRFRILDKSLNRILQVPFPDVAVPIGVFRNLDWRGLRILISENKMTFLTLPELANGVGIWGSGNAAALLHDVNWLSQCELFYWGDLDTQGLEILSRLRANFPRTKSLMMDINTFKQFQKLCRVGTPSKSPCPKNLTSVELGAWEAIRIEHHRIEQERIPTKFTRLAIETVMLPLSAT